MTAALKLVEKQGMDSKNKALDAALAALPPDADGDAIQNALLDVARAIERYQDHTKKSPSGGPGVKLEWFQAV